MGASSDDETGQTNLTINEGGAAVPAPLSRDQAQTFLQQYLSTGSSTPATGSTPSTGNAGTGNTNTGGTGTGAAGTGSSGTGGASGSSGY